MYYYSYFVEVLFRIIFFIILIPFKVIDFICRLVIGVKLAFSNKNRLLTSYYKKNYIGDELNRMILDLAYNYPPSVIWRKFRRHLYHKYIISLMVWVILIIRYTVL